MPLKLAIAAHISPFRMEWFLFQLGLPSAEVWSPGNGLILFSPVKKAVDSHQIAIVPKDQGSRIWILKIVDPAHFHKDIFAAVTLSKRDLEAYKGFAGEKVPTPWWTLGGRIVFETVAGSETPPHRRLLWMQARLVEWKAEKQGRSKGKRGGPGYISVESYFSEYGEGECTTRFARVLKM